jgi:hypothetical protein
VVRERLAGTWVVALPSAEAGAVPRADNHRHTKMDPRIAGKESLLSQGSCGRQTNPMTMTMTMNRLTPCLILVLVCMGGPTALAQGPRTISLDSATVSDLNAAV